jgi:hypothetical protein
LPEPERPQFLAEAHRRLAGTPDALAARDTEEAWGRILDAGGPADVLAAVRYLVARNAAGLTRRMLAALDRILPAADVDARDLARARRLVDEMDPTTAAK